MKKITNSFFFISLFAASNFAFAQTTINLAEQCNCEVYKSTTDINFGATTPTGADVGDLLVDPSGDIFYWDGDSWEIPRGNKNEPWFNVATNTEADSNTQNIYQLGNVGIGTMNPGARLDVDGNVILRNINAGNASDNIVTIDSNGNLRQIDISSIAAQIDTNTTNATLNEDGTNLILTDSDNNTVTIPLANLAAQIDTDTNTTNATLTEDGTNLILTDSENNTVTIALADLAAQIDINTTNATLSEDGTNLILTDSENNTVTIPLADLAAQIDTNTTNATLTEDGTNLILTDSENNTVTIPLADLAAQIDTDTNTTNATLTEDGTDLILTDSENNTVTIALADLAAQIDTNTTNATLSEDGTDLILTDSENNTVTIALADLAAQIDTNTTNATLTEDGTNLILTDSENNTLTIALADLAAQIDTNTTNATLTEDGTNLILTDSENNTVTIALADLAAQIDTNTTNATLTEDGTDLILTDSENNTVTIALADLAAQIDTNTTNATLTEDGTDLILTDSENNTVTIALADLAAQIDTNTTNATLTEDGTDLILTDSENNTVTIALADLAAQIDTNTTNATLSEDGTDLILTDSDNNTVTIALADLAAQIDTNTTNASLTEDGTDLILTDSENNTVTIPLANLAAQIDTNTTNASLSEDGTDLILTDSENNTVTIALADLAAQIDTNTTNATLTQDGTDLILTDSENNTVTIALADLAAQIDTNTTNATLTQDGTDLILTDSDNNTVTIALADLAAQIDTNTTNASLSEDGTDLILTDSDNNTVTIALADLAAQIDTNTTNATLSEDGTNLILTDSENNTVTIALADLAAQIDTNTTNASLSEDGTNLILTDSDNNTVTIPLADLAAQIDTDTNTTNTTLTEDGTDLILTDSDNNTVTIALADLAAQIDTNTTNATLTEDGTNLILTDSDNNTVTIPLADILGTPENIYTTDGTLTGNRIVTQNANTLAFTGTATNAFSVDGSTFSVDANNNRVGINTTSPTQALSVIGNINTSRNLELGELGTGNRTSFIDFHAEDNVDRSFRIRRLEGTDGGVQIQNNGTGAISFLTDFGNTRLTIGSSTNNGNVGVGITNAESRLDVNGDARVRDLPAGINTDAIVTTNAEGNLRQRSLADLAAQINTNTTNATLTEDGTNLILTDSDNNTVTIPLADILGTPENIYTIDGTLTGNRTVTQDANTLAFTGTSNNAFSVDGLTLSVDAANNRVGIGTTTPTAQLSVQGEVNTSGAIELSQLGTGDRTSFIDFHAEDAVDRSFRIRRFPGANGNVAIENEGTGSVLLFTDLGAPGVSISSSANNGNVGVGLNNAEAKLDVNGDARVRDLPAGIDTDGIVTTDADGNLRQRTAAEVVAAGGGVTTNIYTADGALTGNRTVTQDANTLAFTSTATNAFSVDGSSFSVDAANNRVGLGTLTPQHRLDVNGIIKVNGGGATDATSNSQGLQLVWNNPNLGGIIGATGFLNHQGLGTGGFIWSQTNDNVNFTEFMRITGAGNLGLGTASPQAKLHVSNTSGVNLLCSGSTASVIQMREEDASKSWFMVSDGLDFNIRENGTANINTRFAIEDGGNIGVGTPNPNRKLTVIAPPGEAIVRVSEPGLRGGILELGNERHGVKRGYNSVANDVGLHTADGAIHLSTNNIAGDAIGEFILNDAGNVGIGTATPVEKLDVNGGNVRVTGGSFIDDGVTVVAPDYVFENYFQGYSKLKENYTFKSLESIEKFVKENNHLPGIKSAYQIQKDGWDLSFSSRFNLEKVEELFLHAIAQQKKIESQESEIKNQDEKIKKLSSALNDITAQVEALKALIKK